MSDAPVESNQETADRLRAAVARLARLMRQQGDFDLGATSAGALVATVLRGPITLSELAASEQVTPPTITKVVEKLEAKGLVTREVDAIDRRVTRVSATKAGERYLQRTRARRTAWLASRLGQLTAEQRARLTDAIDALEALAVQQDASEGESASK